ncbi:RAM signaling pathway protein-domain-containing protein [Mrakia frigida]|uniref:RAM signaling pathway protein-domain-containing protein n=1 Tax=Mrakia frigida TaxID=29902 RepID=UPI003FCBEFC7
MPNASSSASSPSTAVVVRITPLLLQQAAEASRDGGDTLDFSRSRLTEVGEEGLDGLAAGSGGKGVRRLALSHNSLTSLPTSFLILTRLRYLNLKGNDLREVPAVLGSLQSLEILDISRNKIKRMPEKPGRLASLRVLSLSQNRLRALPAYMADFTELKVFKVEQNPLEWPPREIMDRPANSEGEEAEKLWILSIREFMRAGSGGGSGDEATDNGPHLANNRTNHVRTPSRTTQSHSRSDSHQSSSSHYRSYSNSNPNFPPSMSLDSFASPPVDREHGRNDSSSTRGSSTNHSTETVTPRPRPHSRTLSNSASRPPSPPSSEGRDKLDQVVLPPPRIAADGYPSPSPSPIDGPSHIDRLPPPPPILEDSPYDPSSNDSSPLDPSFLPSSSSSTPRDRSTPSHLSHSRNASFNSQPQRLSQLLSAKKSLPDLRQPHSQIMSDRQGTTSRWPTNAVASGSGSSSRGGGKVGGVGMAQSRTTLSGEGSEGGGGGGGEPTTTQRVGGVPGSLRSIRRKLSDDGMRRPAIGSPLSQQGGGAPFPSGRPLQESNILDPSLTSSPPDASRDSYFRRLSTLQGSTLPKTVPPALLTLIDSARGLLFALSQIQSSLRQHSFSALDGVFSGVLAKVLAPAGEYTDRLINALDRFDSISRRAAVPPPEVIRGVVEACKDDVAVFGKVIAVLLIQLKASSAQQASTSYEDVRFSRTLLLMLYGAMAEVANAWKNMHPLIDAVAPLLRDLPRPVTPTSRQHQHHIPTISNTTGTPISPIPERTESYSPPSINHPSPVALTRSISAQPFPSSLVSSPSPSPSAILTPGPGSGSGSGPAPPSTPGPPSQAARSKSRRHAGSFSSHDVQVGARIPPMPSPSPGFILEGPIVPTHPPATHKPSTSSSTSPPNPFSHQIPLRSALRNPFASPTSSPNPNGGPPPNVTYDTSPFSPSEGFPPPRGPTNGLHTVNGSLSPNPTSPNSMSSPAMGGPSSFSAMGMGGGGGHSTSSSMSSSIGVPISPRIEKDRYLFGGGAGVGRDGGGGGGGGMLEVGGGGRGDATNRVVDEEMLDTMGVAVEAAFGVWVLVEEDMSGDFVSLCSPSLGLALCELKLNRRRVRPLSNLER